jgi:hypothetical protein
MKIIALPLVELANQYLDLLEEFEYVYKLKRKSLGYEKQKKLNKKLLDLQTKLVNEFPPSLVQENMVKDWIDEQRSRRYKKGKYEKKEN